MELAIVESCKMVLDQLEYGHGELAYEKALIYELKCRGIKCEGEVDITEYYTDSSGEEHYITTLRIDVLIKENENMNIKKTILELKTVKSALKEGEKEYIQALRYKRLTGAEECYLINFGYKGLEIYNCCGEFVNLCDENNVLQLDI